jgi:hypothetical protein
MDSTSPVALYLLFWSVVMVRATFKWGLAWGGWFFLVGLLILITLWRMWRIASYVLFGGVVPFVAISQGTNFLPPSAKKGRYRP